MVYPYFFPANKVLNSKVAHTKLHMPFSRVLVAGSRAIKLHPSVVLGPIAELCIDACQVRAAANRSFHPTLLWHSVFNLFSLTVMEISGQGHSTSDGVGQQVFDMKLGDTISVEAAYQQMCPTWPRHLLYCIPYCYNRMPKTKSKLPHYNIKAIKS